MSRGVLQVGVRAMRWGYAGGGVWGEWWVIGVGFCGDGCGCRCSAMWVGAEGVTMSVCMSAGVLKMAALRGSYGGLFGVLGVVCMC